VTQVESSPRRARRSAGQSLPEGGTPAQHDPALAGQRQPDQGRRGSHATPYGQGFSWVLLWTILGALIPGSGLIAAGSRRIGASLLFLIGLVGVGLAAMALVGDPAKRLRSLAVDPQQLLIVALIIGLVALAWIGIILATNTQLLRYATLTAGQRVFSGMVVVALIIGVGLPAFAVSHDALITRDLIGSVTSDEVGGAGPDSAKADPWAGIPRMNVLLIGSDAGRGRIGVRPDTLILASINTKTGDTVLFSLPRNLERVPFPLGTPGNQAWPEGYYCPGDACLLNAIWQWGTTDGRSYYKSAKNPGLAATEDAVQGVTGLRVDTYVMLNLKGFSQFIDAIGGLRVNVDERLPIGGNSEHPEQTSGYLEKGHNRLLDGYQTLWFARSRWSTNDFDRMKRQRCVIGAVAQQADPAKMVLNFPKIAKAAKDNLSMGIHQSQLEAWVELAQRIKGASVRSLPFTSDVVEDRTNPDYQQIHELVTKALKPKVKATATPTPSVSASTAVKAKKKTAVIDPSKAQDVKDVC
jgi:LCP family protein required for cell wall assembly